MPTPHPTAPPDNGASYYRMSTDHQEASIPEQRDWARGAAAADGCHLAGEFEDQAIPGSEIESRPGLAQLVAFVEERSKLGRPVGRLYLWDVDRLSRASSIRTAAILDRLIQAGLTCLRTAEETINLEEDLDLVLLNLRQDLGKAAYAKSIGKNTLRSRQARARLGLWPGGPLPIGYQKGPDGKLTPDPLWAPWVRWIFERYSTSADSMPELARALNANPLAPRPPKGEWTKALIWAVLTRRTYLGEVRYGDKVCGKYYRTTGGQVGKASGNRGQRRRVKAPEGSAIVVAGAHEPLTGPDVFAACARKLGASSWTKEHHSGRRGEWVLTEFARCGVCGGRMRGRTYQKRRKSGKGYTYRVLFCPGRESGRGEGCPGRARQDVVMRELAALVKEQFGSPERIGRIGRKVEKLLSAQADEQQLARGQLADRLAQLDRDIATGARRLLTLPEEVLDDARRAFDGLKAERGDVAARLAGAEESRKVGAAEAGRMRAALADLSRLEEVIAEEPAGTVRDLLSRIVAKVTLHFGPPAGRGARCPHKRPLEHVDVTFRPEVSHLFGASSSASQVALTLRRDVDSA